MIPLEGIPGIGDEHTPRGYNREVAPVVQKTYQVAGMTCGHCEQAVSGEVGKVAGVTGVAVDLAAGTVTVSGEAFSDTEIGAAVDEAGYELVGAAG
jgi:copper chaperone CopZ